MLVFLGCCIGLFDGLSTEVVLLIVILKCLCMMISGLEVFVKFGSLTYIFKNVHAK